jgi:hypothetical protein
MAKKTEKEMFWQKKFELVISENGKFQKRTQQLETELNEAKTELAELESLFELQHKRSLEAMKLWQDAHNEPDVWPDLGKLLTWLLERGQGCFSCKYGPMCSKKPAVCSGCSFAMKDPADGVSRWEPKEAERCKIHRAD